MSFAAHYRIGSEVGKALTSGIDQHPPLANGPAEAARRIADNALAVPLRRETLLVLLRSEDDALVAHALSGLFAGGGPLSGVLEAFRVLYLREEAGTPLPARGRLHRDLLLRLSADPALPPRSHDAICAAVARYMARPAPAGLWRDIGAIVRTLTTAHAASDPARLLDVRLMRAAARIMDFDTAFRLADLWLDSARDPAFCPALSQMINIAIGLAVRLPVKPYALACHQALPSDPLAIHNYARVLDEEFVPFATIVRLYDAIQTSGNENQYRQTLSWAARRCFAEGLSGEANRLYAMLPEGDWPGKPHDSALQLRVLSGETGADVPLRAPPQVGIAFTNDRLGEIVRRAAAAAFRDKTYDGPQTAEEIAADYRRMLSELTELPAGADEPIADSQQAAVRLQQIANAYFSQTRDLTLYTDEPKYGVLQIAQMQAAYFGLTRLVEQLVRRGLALIAAGTPVAGAVELSRLADLGVRSALALKQPARAREVLAACEAYGIMAMPLARLREACALHEGDMAAAAASAGPSALAASALMPIVGRDTWTAMETLAWAEIAADPEIPGRFDVVWPNGVAVTYDHAVAPISVRVTHHTALTSMWGEVLRGRSGAIVRAQRMHYTKVYPTPDTRILNQELAGLRWRHEEVVEIGEPVVVLETFDATRHMNYYHWVIFLLSRIHLAQRMGYLKTRKLVVTEALALWMLDSLGAIGVAKDDLLEITLDKSYRYRDALLISSVEDISRSIIEPMAADILSRCEPSQPGPRHLYLSRRNNTRRSILNADELEALAENLGYAIIRPEEHSFIEQARIFSRASAIAAPEGAALTNTIYVPPGARILTFLSQNEMFPFFNDIAIMKGHHHRKIACAAERDEYGAHYIWAPYSVDLDIAEAHLRWAMEHQD